MAEHTVRHKGVERKRIEIEGKWKLPCQTPGELSARLKESYTNRKQGVIKETPSRTTGDKTPENEK